VRGVLPAGSAQDVRCHGQQRVGHLVQPLAHGRDDRVRARGLQHQGDAGRIQIIRVARGRDPADGRRQHHRGRQGDAPAQEGVVTG